LLAVALNNLVIRLAEAERHEQALPPAREAVTIYRRLAEADPDSHLPDLAGALSSLATRLADTDRREQALAPAQEAVDHYHHLAKARPDRYGSDAGAAAALLNRLSPG
jgi:hypothetical protein